jgi:hypothetical protein
MSQAGAREARSEVTCYLLVKAVIVKLKTAAGIDNRRLDRNVGGKGIYDED